MRKYEKKGYFHINTRLYLSVEQNGINIKNECKCNFNKSLYEMASIVFETCAPIKRG